MQMHYDNIYVIILGIDFLHGKLLLSFDTKIIIHYPYCNRSETIYSGWLNITEVRVHSETLYNISKYRLT